MSQTPQDPQSYPPAPPPQEGWGSQAAGYAAPGAAGPAPYADWLKRVGGYLIDMLLLIPAYIIVFVGVGIAGSGTPGDTSGAALLFMLIGYVGMFGVIIWNQIIRQGKTGWSIGKQVVGIRLIGEKTGQPIGPGLTFVRMLAHVLDSLACYVGWLWPLWDQKRQTFADKIMSTVVIVQKKA